MVICNLQQESFDISYKYFDKVRINDYKQVLSNIVNETWVVDVDLKAVASRIFVSYLLQ